MKRMLVRMEDVNVCRYRYPYPVKLFRIHYFFIYFLIVALNAEVWGAPNAILELANKLLHDSNYQTPFFNDYNWLVTYFC